MKRILIPTDFSNNAWNAICYAMRLFQNRECDFILLNTYTPVIPNSRFMAPMANGIRIEDTVSATSENGLKKTIRQINTTFNNPIHTFGAISSFNLLADEVKNVVESYKIDLIVTGTKGASGMEEVFMGSNTVRIIKSSKRCPILAVPQCFGFTAPSEIAFATDFTRFYSLTELMPLINLSQSFGATIRIVYVQSKIKALTELQQFNLNMLCKYFAHVAHYIHTVSELDSVSNTLNVFSTELDIHLMAMVHYHHSYLEKMTREPIVKRTAFNTQVPLLVIPELSRETVTQSKENQRMQVIQTNGQ